MLLWPWWWGRSFPFLNNFIRELSLSLVLCDDACPFFRCITDASFLRNIPGSQDASSKTHSGAHGVDASREEMDVELCNVDRMQRRCESLLASLPTSLAEDLMSLDRDLKNENSDQRSCQAIAMRLECKRVIVGALEALQLYAVSIQEEIGS